MAVPVACAIHKEKGAEGDRATLRLRRVQRIHCIDTKAKWLFRGLLALGTYISAPETCVKNRPLTTGQNKWQTLVVVGQVLLHRSLWIQANQVWGYDRIVSCLPPHHVVSVRIGDVLSMYASGKTGVQIRRIPFYAPCRFHSKIVLTRIDAVPSKLCTATRSTHAACVGAPRDLEIEPWTTGNTLRNQALHGRYIADRAHTHHIPHTL